MLLFFSSLNDCLKSNKKNPTKCEKNKEKLLKIQRNGIFNIYVRSMLKEGQLLDVTLNLIIKQSHITEKRRTTVLYIYVASNNKTHLENNNKTIK